MCVRVSIVRFRVRVRRRNERIALPRTMSGGKKKKEIKNIITGRVNDNDVLGASRHLFFFRPHRAPTCRGLRRFQPFRRCIYSTAVYRPQRIQDRGRFLLLPPPTVIHQCHKETLSSTLRKTGQIYCVVFLIYFCIVLRGSGLAREMREWSLPEPSFIPRLWGGGVQDPVIHNLRGPTDNLNGLFIEIRTLHYYAKHSRSQSDFLSQKSTSLS